MTAKQSTLPKVRIARPGGRPFQLRYRDPETGKEVRISLGCRDESIAQSEKGKLEAKLLLGLETKRARKQTGPIMRWADFRDEYSRMKVATFRSEQSRAATEIRLDVCEAIAQPKRLADMTKPETLARLQAELLVGAESKLDRRSPTTVKSYMRHLLVALNWATEMNWIPTVRFKLLDIESGDLAKGRPITTEEFERMLAACDHVCKRDPESWKRLLRGLWESGLRLAEIMALSWDLDDTIRPVWTRSGYCLLVIPAALQKSRKSQEVPTTAAFSELLQRTHENARTGYVFNPDKRNGRSGRMHHKQVGRAITDIGRRANVAVSSDGKPASAHDLRRSFGQRMADAGLPTRDLQSIMRHASITTTENYYLRHRAADQAERIAKVLGPTVPTF